MKDSVIYVGSCSNIIVDSNRLKIPCGIHNPTAAVQNNRILDVIYFLNITKTISGKFSSLDVQQETYDQQEHAQLQLLTREATELFLIWHFKRQDSIRPAAGRLSCRRRRRRQHAAANFEFSGADRRPERNRSSKQLFLVHW